MYNYRYVTNEDREKIANFANEMGRKGFPFGIGNIAHCIDRNSAYSRECWERLADLIMPSISIDDVYNWAFANLEGCDEPEFSLFDNILGAISTYKRNINERNKRLKESDNEQVD